MDDRKGARSGHRCIRKIAVWTAAGIGSRPPLPNQMSFCPACTAADKLLVVLRARQRKGCLARRGSNFSPCLQPAKAYPLGLLRSGSRAALHPLLFS